MAFYISTRGDRTRVSGAQAILAGIAPDGGLFVPDTAVKLPIRELMEMDFCGMARSVLRAYLSGYEEEELAACVRGAYENTFSAPDVANLVAVGDAFVLELFHGPTCAFKDIALSILPRLMAVARKKLAPEEKILILTATSGDTGSAALHGFCHAEGISIIVFYPENGVSAIQRAQMVTMRGENLRVCAVRGNFDDAQTGVKQIFSDSALAQALAKRHIRLSSANSINIGRLVPQMVYYLSAYAALVKRGRIHFGEAVNFAVPTGNFGNILAGYLMKQAGLPVGRLICASNQNHVLTDFLTHGVYDRQRTFFHTSSPSMDILVSSNLERLLYEASGRNSDVVRRCMDALQKNGVYRVDSEVLRAIQADFSAGCATDAEVSETIARVFRTHHYLMDPHTAVAWHVAETMPADGAPTVVLSTASPGKFPESVLRALGETPDGDSFAMLTRLKVQTGAPLPEHLCALAKQPLLHTDVVDVCAMRQYVQTKVGEMK